MKSSFGDHCRRLRLLLLEDRTVPAIFLVNSTGDLGAGSGTTGDLRFCINHANDELHFPGEDTITFDASVFGTPRTITLSGVVLNITAPLAISGPVVNVTINAGSLSGVFAIDVPGSDHNPVVMSNLILTNGATSDGGAIFNNDEAVSLTNVTINNCTASNTGGGIYSDNGSLTLAHCTVSGNSATTGGGIDIYEDTDVTLIDSTVSGNSSTEGGGGLYFFYGGSLDMFGSTISGNTSNTVSAPGGGGGGGLYLFYTPTTITNSTISGNSTVADGDGGGIWNFGGDAYLTIINSTIAFNHSAGYGGGLEFGVIMDSTIVANNTANGVGPDMNGPAIATNCLFSNSDGVIIIGSGTGDLLDVDPMLDVLANNGGPTQTHALLAGSPAIDAGSNQLNLTTDQRGAGFNRTIGLGPDMGAFEVQPTATPTVTGVQVNDGSAQRSRVTSLTVTFSMQVSFATTPGAAFTLTRASDGAAVGFAATASVLGGVTVVTLNNFVGSAAELGSLADGRYILTALASQISANGQQMTSNYTFGAAQGLFRLFGDVNGDQNVNGFDLGFFRNAFGTQTSDPNFLSYLDFNGDGVINGFDLGQFRTRFGTMLP